MISLVKYPSGKPWAEMYTFHTQEYPPGIPVPVHKVWVVKDETCLIENEDKPYLPKLQSQPHHCPAHLTSTAGFQDILQME